MFFHIKFIVTFFNCSVPIIFFQSVNSSNIYFVNLPNEKLSILTKKDPAKSCIIPLEVPIPVRPIDGNKYEINGIGVQIIQYGKWFDFKFISFLDDKSEVDHLSNSWKFILFWLIFFHLKIKYNYYFYYILIFDF